MALEFVEIIVPEYNKLEHDEQARVWDQGRKIWQSVQDQLSQDENDLTDTISTIFDTWSFLSDDTITKIRQQFETRVEQCKRAGELPPT